VSTALPIEEIRAPLVQAFARDGANRVVIDAPTGSGKSTQIPQMLLDEGLVEERIVVLQPRRLAARMLARRVASERSGAVGGEVGYQVRFDRQWGEKTRIVYVTEGLLLRWLHSDPTLQGIGAVVLDEFHERHLDGDVALAILRRLQGDARPDLKLVVMSATLPGAELEEILSPCTFLRSEGRSFPVEIRYSAPRARTSGGQRSGRDQRQTEPIWESAARACRECLEELDTGHLLVFMPGAFEIRKTIETIERASWSRGIKVCPLFGDLSPAAQDAAVSSGGPRRIVVATNVAETSITIDGVLAVIDSGLARSAAFDPRRGINTLTVQSVSRASADQRSGRAGRTAPGIGIRLWSAQSHERLPPFERPEIHRVDLSECFLSLMASGFGDPRELPWLEAPTPEETNRAFHLLESLGAWNADTAEVTDLGRRMAGFPLHPRWSRMLIAASESEFPCVPTAALCASLVGGRGLFLRGRGGKTRAPDFTEDDDISDFQPLLRAYYWAAQNNFDGRACSALGLLGTAAREARKESELLLRLAQDNGLVAGEADDPPGEILAKVLLAGFSDQVAVRAGEGSPVCLVAGGRRGKLSENTVVRRQKILLATEINEIEGRDLQVLLGQATAVEEAWLEELFPGDLEDGGEDLWDDRQRRVVHREVKRFRDLILIERERGEPSEENAARILAEKVITGELVLKKWDDAVHQWMARVNCLAQWMPELEIVPLEGDDLLEMVAQVCHGAKSYKEIKDREVLGALQGWLSQPQQSALKSYAPREIKLGNGNSAKVRYECAPKPDARISVVLQRLYDVAASPCVADGRVPVTVEILAPNQRPAQVTQDLAAFWETSYEAVKKDLKGRYPKHEWR